MEPALLAILLLIFLIAFVYSNIGLGGGMLFTPLLVAFAFADKDTIVCISLFLVMATSIAAAYNHWRGNLIKYRYGLLIAAFSIPGSITGVFIGLRIHYSIFYLLFAILVFTVGTKMLYDTLRNNNACVERKITTKDYIVVALISYFSGIISAIFGVGGGVFNVPVLLYILSCRTKEASGTSSFTICLTTLGGILTNALLLPTFSTASVSAMFLAPVAFLGALIGSRIGIKKLKEKPLKVIFISMLFLAGIQMVWKFLG
ncbi:MAG: sulfite exporter TauE/SafE family protein [Thermoplasmata archaeon]|nr:sulfite exporter TauE/SafE family protein [Thermoplasmata archaeon]